MMNILKSLCSPHRRISVLLSVSVLAVLFCILNLPIVFVGLIEILILIGCIAFFRKVDVTQYELFQYKPHWIWRICEWYWTMWFCFNKLPFIKWLGNCYPTLKYAYFVYPSVFKPITDFAISNYGKEIAVRRLSVIMLAPVIIMTMPVIYYCFRWLFKQIAEFIQSFTKFEKIYLAASSSVLIAILITVSSKTSFFVYPIDRELYLSENDRDIILDFSYYEQKYEFENVLYCDHFFDTDTANRLRNHYYDTSSDYCRHPFYHYACIIFTPLYYLIGKILFLFFSSFVYCVSLGIAVVQIVLFVIIGVLLKRLFLPLLNNSYSNILAVLYVCSFPVVFSFCPERLVFSSFFLVLAVYYSLGENKLLQSLLVQLAAIGTTALSLLPSILLNFFNRKYLRIVIILFVLLYVSLYRNYEWINTNTRFIPESSSVYSRMCSYFQFVSSCVLTPNNEIIDKDFEIIQTRSEGLRLYPSRLIVVSAPSMIDTITGIILFCLCCCSILRLRFNKLNIICSFWILLSVGIICVIGFGNSYCVLYCSYFSWAIIPLALLPFYWLWQKHPRLPIPQALYLFAAYLAISNLYFIYQVVQVVSERYIVPPGM